MSRKSPYGLSFTAVEIRCHPCEVFWDLLVKSPVQKLSCCFLPCGLWCGAHGGGSHRSRKTDGGGSTSSTAPLTLPHMMPPTQPDCHTCRYLGSPASVPGHPAGSLVSSSSINHHCVDCHGWCEPFFPTFPPAP